MTTRAGTMSRNFVTNYPSWARHLTKLTREHVPTLSPLSLANVVLLTVNKRFTTTLVLLLLPALTVKLNRRYCVSAR